MKKLSLSLLIATSVLTLTACVATRFERSDTSSSEKIKKEVKESSSASSTKAELAPELTVKDETGEVIKLSDYKGKKVYINVWATWCGPCRREMPELEKVYQNHKGEEDLVFLSVTSPNDAEFENRQPQDEDKDYILETADELGVTYPVLFDYQDSLTNYNIRAIPTHIFINSDGTLAQQIPGATTAEYIEAELEKLH